MMGQLAALYFCRRQSRIAETMDTVQDIAKTPEYRSVVEDYRATCLWSMGDALHPRNRAQLEQVLSAVEKNGDLAGYRRAGEIRKWLSPDSRRKSCGGSPVCG